MDSGSSNGSVGAMRGEVGTNNQDDNSYGYQYCSNIHTDSDTTTGIGMGPILIPLPGTLTHNVLGICISIGTIPILDLIPIPIP